MKKVALIMESWKRYFTSAWPKGFADKVKASGEDVSLYIFNCSDGLSRTKDFQTGEYNIFSLPNFTDFDGVILDVNNIHSSIVHEKVVDRVKQAHIPTLSIAAPIDDFIYVGIDNYKAMRGVIEHLHKEHDCKKFYFVMGPEDNYENSERARALADYLYEAGIKQEPEDFYFESFDYSCGVKGFEKFISQNKPLPDAIICGNDNIAVGVCEAAKSHGYEIPKDFYVTGFDDFDKASYYIPRITTVGHIREEVGELCAELLLKIWRGETVSRFDYTNTQLIAQESCGCKRPPLDAAALLRDRILNSVEDDNYEEQIISLRYDLSKCLSIEAMMNVMDSYMEPLGCEGFYIVLDPAIKQGNSFYSENDRQKLLSDDMFHTSGYPRRMQLMFAYENGKRITPESEMVDSLFPIFQTATSKTFLFLPMHFRDKTVGYIAIREPIYAMERTYLARVISAITSALENFHRRQVLEDMNKVLSDLYVKDAMTGLYNRFGLQKFRREFVENAFEKGQKVLVLFIDLDRLKMINDTYGHGQGDFAITTVAQAMFHYTQANSIPARTGGDEFVMLEIYQGEEHLKEMMENLRRDVAERGNLMRFPTTITISIGYAIMSRENGKKFDEAIREADDMMYEEKVKKHAERT